jgi:dolichol-phosphate mannosyltransferase
MRSRGYSYVEELLWMLKRAGARIGETPIVFVDRRWGRTKINWREAVAALVIIFRLGIRNYLHL